MVQPLHLTCCHNGYISHGRNQSSHHDGMTQPLHLTMEGTNPLTMSEWLTDSSLLVGGNLDLENIKLLHEVLKLHFGQWLHQYISYLFHHRNILELHYSSLHHIPNIVVLDLDILRLVMEDRVLRQLHTTLLSQCIQVPSNWRSNKSDSSFLSHTASQLAEQATTYSTSAVLSATQDCFLLNKQQPEVFFLSMALLAQSQST